MHAGIDGLRLLLVEDEYLLALYLGELIEELGARVVGPVASVAAALELIDHGPAIDGAILDVNLAGEPVFAVADALAARQVPFVFASGYDREALPERFRHIGLCQKPIDANAVLAAVQAFRSRAAHAAPDPRAR